MLQVVQITIPTAQKDALILPRHTVLNKEKGKCSDMFVTLEITDDNDLLQFEQNIVVSTYFT